MKHRSSRRPKTLALTMSLLVLACGQQAEHETQPVYLSSPRTQSMNLPFSEAVRVGNTLYLSGQLGIDYASGQLVKGGIAAETRQTMENIKATLERNGSSLEDVVKCTVMMADISEWQAMNEVYVTFFPNHKPARSAFGANGLALGARLEIECIAALD